MTILFACYYLIFFSDAVSILLKTKPNVIYLHLRVSIANQDLRREMNRERRGQEWTLRGTKNDCCVILIISHGYYRSHNLTLTKKKNLENQWHDSMWWPDNHMSQVHKSQTLNRCPESESQLPKIKKKRT